MCFKIKSSWFTCAIIKVYMYIFFSCSCPFNVINHNIFVAWRMRLYEYSWMQIWLCFLLFSLMWLISIPSHSSFTEALLILFFCRDIISVIEYKQERFILFWKPPNIFTFLFVCKYVHLFKNYELFIYVIYSSICI